MGVMTAFLKLLLDVQLELGEVALLQVLAEELALVLSHSLHVFFLFLNEV